MHNAWYMISKRDNELFSVQQFVIISFKTIYNETIILDSVLVIFKVLDIVLSLVW